MKVGDIKTWKELKIGVQQLVKLLFHNNFITPGLALEKTELLPTEDFECNTYFTATVNYQILNGQNTVNSVVAKTILC